LTTGDTSYIEQTVIDGDSAGSVVTFESGENYLTKILGFTIRNGFSETGGGGIKADSASNPRIWSNYIFHNSTSERGGGIECISNSSPEIKDNYIIENSAEVGGGIYTNFSQPAIIDNRIIANIATLSSGGGISIWGFNSIIENNHIRDNISNGSGGGIYCRSSSAATIKGNTINGNSANGYGGGIYFHGCDHLQLIANDITDNSASDPGGALYFYHNTNVKIAGNRIENNSSNYGAAVYLFHDNIGPIFYNNAIINNEATVGGGGFYSVDSSPKMINNVIANNYADSAGGGLIILDESFPTIKNCIVWNDRAAIHNEIYCDSSSTPIIEYCDVEGGWPGIGNIDIDPLFRDTSDSDFHIMSTGCGDTADSPCIDTGEPAILDSLLDCSWGLGFEVSDIGAFAGGMLDQNNAGVLNVPGEYATIQSAIDASTAGDTVLVHPGIYYENINFIGRAIIVGSLYLTTGDTSFISSTIIDGQAQNSVVIFESGEDNTSEIIGFTIRNGQARPYGGGIYCIYSSPVIRNNKIMGNHAEGPSMDSVYWGGGIACISSNAVITNNIISGNIADIRAGVYCVRARPTITYNVICNNSVANYGNTDLSGGGLSIGGGSPLIANNIIRDNYGGWSGGGVMIDGSFSLLYGNIITGNSADNRGGGVVIEDLSYPQLMNNVIYNNIADGSSHVSMGGGIAILFNSYPTLINNILWGDSADYDHEIHFFEASAIIQYSDIEGGFPGTGNIGVDLPRSRKRRFPSHVHRLRRFGRLPLHRRRRSRYPRQLAGLLVGPGRHAQRYGRLRRWGFADNRDLR
jgi:parallel beta-helix repeat protein